MENLMTDQGLIVRWSDLDEVLSISDPVTGDSWISAFGIEELEALKEYFQHLKDEELGRHSKPFRPGRDGVSRGWVYFRQPRRGGKKI